MPGRVNLIGEHTDYNEGFVFPAAIELRISGLFSRSNNLNLVSGQTKPIVHDLTDEKMPKRGWIRYALACSKAITQVTGHHLGLQGVISTELPTGCGLSSSAALEVCLVGAFNVAYQLGLTKEQIAEIAWVAENEFVGVKCGRMDQMASTHGKRGNALLIDMRSLEVEPIEIPKNLKIAILNTGKRRSLTTSAFNERVKECQASVACIQQTEPHINSLRDASIELLQKTDLPPLLNKRARHVITENGRTQEFKSALISNNFTALGELCKASHASLRDDYEVSSKELDALARAAWCAPGCVAARMTGAGFGGCCVALVESELIADFFASVKASYHVHGFSPPTLITTNASEGIQTEPYL